MQSRTESYNPWIDAFQASLPPPPGGAYCRNLATVPRRPQTGDTAPSLCRFPARVTKHWTDCKSEIQTQIKLEIPNWLCYKDNIIHPPPPPMCQPKHPNCD